MNWFRVILGMAILTTAGIISLVGWYKEVDRKTTWIYAVYIGIMLILFLFVLIGLEQYWTTY